MKAEKIKVHTALDIKLFQLFYIYFRRLDLKQTENFTNKEHSFVSAQTFQVVIHI